MEALGRIGGDAACDALIQVFRTSDNDLTLADASAAELGRMACARSRIGALVAQPFSPMLADKLVALLGAIGGDEAASALEGILGTWSISPVVQAAALRELGRTGSADRADATALALWGRSLRGGAAHESGSRNGMLTVYASTASTETAALEGLRLWVAVRGTLNPRAIDPLLETLRGPMATSPARVEVIARLIGYTRSPRAPAVLARLLDADDDALRQAAGQGRWCALGSRALRRGW